MSKKSEDQKAVELLRKIFEGDQPTVRDSVLNHIRRDGSYLLQFNQSIILDGKDTYVRACRRVRTMREYNETMANAAVTLTEREWATLSKRYLEQEKIATFERPVDCSCNREADVYHLCDSCVEARNAKRIEDEKDEALRDKVDQDLWEESAE